jgi:hypothetical protein
MKNYVFLIVMFLFFSGFSKPIPNPGIEDAMQSINGFYEAMSSFNHQKIGNYCTSEFSVIDNAVYYKSLEEFVELIKTFEGSKMKYSMKVENSRMESKSGLIILTFDVDIEMGEQKMHITALENYVMKKVKGKWLIDFIHSSPTNPVEY